MASKKSLLEYLLSLNDKLTARPMMGEYLLYYLGKYVACLCDDTLYVKNLIEVKKLLPNSTLKSPYDGARPMIVFEEYEDISKLDLVLQTVYNALK